MHHKLIDIPLGSELRNIGPAEAKDLLSRKGRKNRPLKRYWVKHLARLMTDDQWYRSNDAIALDENGACINGQHRLNAVILSNTTQAFLVLENVSHAEQIAMDQGLRRSIRDVFSLEGISIPKEALTALRLIEYLPNAIEGDRRSPERLLAAWEVHEMAIRFAIDHAFSRGTTRDTPPAALCVVARALYAEPALERQIARFGEIMKTGLREDGEEATAIILFRNYIMSTIGNRSSQTMFQTYKRGQNAMLHWLEGRTPKILRSIDEDLFPLPYERRSFTRNAP